MVQVRRFLHTSPPADAHKCGALWRCARQASSYWTYTFVKMQKVWVAFATAYFKDGVDNDRAEEIVSGLQGVVQKGFPLVLTADFNATVEEVTKAGIPGRLGTFIVATGARTSTLREIDFSLVSHSLGNAFAGITQLIGPFATHVGLRLGLRKGAALTHWVRKVPRNLPPLAKEVQNSEAAIQCWLKHASKLGSPWEALARITASEEFWEQPSHLKDYGFPEVFAAAATVAATPDEDVRSELSFQPVDSGMLTPTPKLV